MAERTEELGGADYDPVKGVPPEAYTPQAIHKAFDHWCNIAFDVVPEDKPLGSQIRLTAELLLEQLALYEVLEG